MICVSSHWKLYQSLMVSEWHLVRNALTVTVNSCNLEQNYPLLSGSPTHLNKCQLKHSLPLFRDLRIGRLRPNWIPNRIGLYDSNSNRISNRIGHNYIPLKASSTLATIVAVFESNWISKLCRSLVSSHLYPHLRFIIQLHRRQLYKIQMFLFIVLYCDRN